MTNLVGSTGHAAIVLGSAGETFTRISSLIDGVVVIWTPTFTDLGGGAYEAEQTFTSAGLWQWIGTASDLTPIVINWTVVASSAAGPPLSTLTDVRRAVHDKLDDLIVLTADSAGATNSISDFASIFDSADSYVASHLYFVSGTVPNIGKLAKVTGGDETYGIVNYEPETPLAVASGDVADLHNLHGSGWTRAEVVRRINQRIQESFPNVLIPRIDAIAGTFSYRAPVIAVPEGVTHVSQPQWADRYGEWYDVPPMQWRANPATGTIEISGASGGWANGQTVRLIGYGRHPQVVNEADGIAIDPEWLVLAVASELASQRSDRQHQQQWIEWSRKADERLGNMMTPHLNNTRRIR